MANTTTPGTSRDLRARVDEGWRPFRDAVRALGRGRMDERTSAGWTYGALVAHVAAWEALTARRLRVFRETGEQARPAEAEDIDAFNARVVGTHRLVGAEALLDELDTSHRALVGEIAQLTDAQVSHDVHETPWGPASWVVTIVAGNSYGHYAEHAEELAAPPLVTREDMTERGLDGW